MGEHIILGFDNNIDYEIAWNSNVFEQLINTFSIKKSEICNKNPINSVRDLIISILGFLKNGTGGERFVASPQIIEDFAVHFEKKNNHRRYICPSSRCYEEIGIYFSSSSCDYKRLCTKTHSAR